MLGEHSPWVAWGPGLLGAALTLVSFVFPLPAATRLSRRLRHLREAPVFADLARASALRSRVASRAQELETLAVRGEAAITSMNASVRELRLPQAVDALRLVGASVAALIEALRARR